MTRNLSRFLFLVLLSAVLVGTAQAQYGYYFGRNKIQYHHFDWHILKTEHFDIYFYPEMQELAEHGAFFAENAYDDLQNKFDFSLNERVPIIFYSSNLHFKQTNITPGFIPDGVGGFFEFLKGRVVIPANGNLHQFRRVIRHELVHVFTYSRVLRVVRDHRVPADRFLPLWFTEGLAEYWSGDPDHQHEMLMRDAIFSNYLVPLENIFRINGSYQMYKQGEALFHFFSETYGEEKILELIENFWMHRTFKKVIEITLQEDYQTIDAAWQEWLKKRYLPILEESEMTTLIADGISTKGYNFKPVFYQFKDGRRRLYFVANRTGYSNVYQIDIDSLYRPIGQATILVRGERSDAFEAFHHFDSRMSISADGKLAFVTKSGQADVVHIYDLELDDHLATYSFEGLVAVYSPDWSPDGTQLVFSSIDKGGYSDLYTYCIETNRLHRLTNDSYDDRDPAWSPDGNYIAFSSDRTSEGENYYYNLFAYELDDGQINYVTYGKRLDFSPRWSPDGTQLVFSSTVRDTTSRWQAQDIWVVDVSPLSGEPAEVASASIGVSDGLVTRLANERRLRRLTSITAAVFDPIWTADNQLFFTSFEHYRFTIRHLPQVDSLVAYPKEETYIDLTQSGDHWAFGKIGLTQEVERVPYKRKYNLDFAQGALSQNPIWGTSGGALFSFSDMMGDDQWYFLIYNNSRNQTDFLRSLNFSASRFLLHRRTNVGYGIFRYSGLRYDITDPDAAREYPILWETIWGGSGTVSYPISMFRRLELSTSLSWSDKEIPTKGIDRQAILLSNSVSLVHDNSLFGYNGPVEGWRGNLMAAYTTDIAYSNVSYFTLSADVRHYWRISRDVTFASWGIARMNKGREARLFFLGGSWDLRGFRLFSVRGQKMWFTSHELRFPILTAPGLYVPLLAPFGIANLRGALFVDAAHAWNEDYNEVDLSELQRNQLNIGETVGSTGIGLRLNLFGALVLRYDIGFRYRDGFRERGKFFKQFFFGWDF